MATAEKDSRPSGLAGIHLPKDVVIKIPELGDPQWVRRPAGHWYLPLMFDVAGGITVNVLRYPEPGVIGRHVHDAPVYSYTIEGSWHYPEHDWVAEAGTYSAALAEPLTIAVVGAEDDVVAAALWAVAIRCDDPARALHRLMPERDVERFRSLGYSPDRTAAYVCIGTVCSAPLADEATLAAELDRARRRFERS